MKLMHLHLETVAADTQYVVKHALSASLTSHP